MRTLCVPLLFAATLSAGLAGAKPITVNCPGDSIGAALAGAKKDGPVEIVVTGSCSENVLIDRGGVSIDGSGATLTGIGPASVSAITVQGAQNVTVTGLTIAGGPGSGFEIRRGAAAVLDGVSANDNPRYGVLVIDGSSVIVRNSTFNGNRDGIGVWAGSHATLEGAITCNENSRTGIIVSASNIVALPNPTGLALHDNVFAGLYLQMTSSGQISAPVDVSGSSEGLSVYDGSALAMGVFQSRNNSWAGITLWNNSTFESGGGSAMLEDNLHGLWIEDDSSFSRNGTVTIRNNQDAAAYIESSNVVLRFANSYGNGGGNLGVAGRNASLEITRSTLSDPLNLTFGTRIDGHHNTISTIQCDGTVISELDYPCPPAAKTISLHSAASSVRREREARAPLER